MSAGVVDMLDANPCVGPPRAGAVRWWTMREEKVLREHYPTGGLAACVELLPGRTARAIYMHAGKLRLKAPGSPARRETWKSSEFIDAAIRHVYQRAPTKGDTIRLAQSVMRPRWWVSKRAAVLGLAAPRYKAAAWCEAEIEHLRASVGKKPDAIQAQLARRGFKRTVTAVVVQMKRLGVSLRSDDPDLYTSRGLAEIMGVDAHAVAAWITKGWLKAKRTGESRSSAWLIKRRDVRAFVVENAAAVDIRKVDKFWLIDLLAGRPGMDRDHTRAA